ncbi:MAG: hypothetical protein ACKV2T_04555 [Kofleriaceae bacterium]
MRFASLLLVLAACPAKPPQPPPPTTTPGVGCPTAQNVYLAQYIRPPEGQPGYSGWALALHNTKVDSVEGKPPFGAIDPATATAAGVPPAPQSIWILPPNAPLCKATIGGYYAEAIDAPTKNISYGVTLAGCAAPTNPDDAGIAIGMVSNEPPSECHPLAPRGVAARLGTSEKGAWSRPAKETPIPDAFATIIPERACVAPDCEKLWSIAQIDLANKAVAWSAAVNWLEVPPNADPKSACSWRLDTYSGFFVAGPDGAPVKVTDGQDHPLALFVVLVDKTGAKVLVADGTGEYSTYDLANGAAALGRHLVWMIDDPRAYGAVDHLGPECPPAGP